MKKLVKILAVLVVLVLIVAGVGMLAVDGLARTGIERGATYALQVPTTVASVDVGLMGGTLQIAGLTVANPEGYDAAGAAFLTKMHLFDLGIDSGTLLDETIVVKNFTIDGLDLHIIQKGMTNNVNVILNNLKRFESESKDEETTPGKKLKIDVITVKNVTAHFHLPAAVSSKPIDVVVPEIVLNDVSSDDSGGVVVSQLAAKILPAILAAVMDKARGNATLSGVVSGIDGNLKSLGAAAGEEVRKVLDKVRTGGGGVLNNVLDGIRGKGDETPSEDQ